MDLHGVFLLDGDPPRGVADPADIVFDVFTTGMWVGYVISWLPAVVIGAALGTWVGDRRNLADIRRNAARRRDGIPVPESTWRSFVELAGLYGVAVT